MTGRQRCTDRQTEVYRQADRDVQTKGRERDVQTKGRERETCRQKAERETYR